jgi:hypothetical protein
LVEFTGELCVGQQLRGGFRKPADALVHRISGIDDPGGIRNRGKSLGGGLRLCFPRRGAV